MNERTGGQILVECLAKAGIRRVACVAGESYLPVLDALADRKDIETITCRHESGAGFIAEAWGKLSGQPGVVFVTRGPGACNASIAVHTARQDSTPLIMFMGQVARADRGREAFQEIDVRQVFGGLAKWSTEIDSAERIPEIVARAVREATSDRPGPVVIGLPEDMLAEKSAASLLEIVQASAAPPSQRDLQSLRDRLAKASRPVLIVGGPGWTDKACADLGAFASACHLPVAAAFRRQDIIGHAHNCYIGELGTGPNPKLLERVRAADLIIALGTRLGEITTQGYTLPVPPVAAMDLIHIHACAGELGKVYQPVLAIPADPGAVVAALAGGGAFGIDGRGWAGWRDEARRDYLDWTAIDTDVQRPWNGADMTSIFSHLRETLPADAVVTTDAGNFSGWAQRYLRYGRPARLLAPTSGAMGYAVPSAIGAALACPGRLVLGLCGDGGFMMTGQELATAIHHGAKPVIMVFNNGMYGTIRMHQDRAYPGRPFATSLTNPDFVRLGESYGIHAARVDRAADFPAIWDKARNCGGPALIEVKMDPAQLTTRAMPPSKI